MIFFFTLEYELTVNPGRSPLHEKQEILVIVHKIQNFHFGHSIRTPIDLYHHTDSLINKVYLQLMLCTCTCIVKDFSHWPSWKQVKY